MFIISWILFCCYEKLKHNPFEFLSDQALVCRECYCFRQEIATFPVYFKHLKNKQKEKSKQNTTELLISFIVPTLKLKSVHSGFPNLFEVKVDESAVFWSFCSKFLIIFYIFGILFFQRLCVVISHLFSVVK